MAYPVWTTKSLAKTIAILTAHQARSPDPDLVRALEVLCNTQKSHERDQAIARVTAAGCRTTKKKG